MSEQERAAYYQAHKDEPDEWDESVSERDAPKTQRALSATVTVRFSAEEADRLRQVAQAKELSYSDVVREAVKAYTEPRQSLVGRNVAQDYNSRGVVTMPPPVITPGPGFRIDSGVTSRSQVA